MTDAVSNERMRLDKWLWYARFFKTRGLATKMCTAGKIRIDGTVVTKAHATVKGGEVLTFPQGWHIRVIRVVALGDRRGPATEAQTLYDDLDPPTRETAIAPTVSAAPSSSGFDAGGRPSKKQRRALTRLKDGSPHGGV